MSSNADKIAVVGMACRFPGAENIDEFWNILIEGRDTIKHFTDEELEKSEFEYENLRNNPDYVKAKGVLKDIDKFDPMFFGYLPKEAAELDPQYRIWLETVWSAFENAGCDPLNYDGKIGVFAGGSLNTYLLNNVLRSRRKLEHYIRIRSAESFQTMIANEVSGLPTKTAYKFNLRGPAINVQTACSTSLVAVSMASQSLLLMESDMCIAGGVSVTVPQETGYMFQEGGITSPDGCCRSFDSQAQGTVFSNGVGVVVLKRLEDAIRDKDIIYSIISGWALNNDGNAKISYVAPSIDGQAEVIKMAQYIADVHPEDIGYIEAHGTATPLGDPIELTALTNAFSLKTDKKQFCGIGSVKSNIGHTDVVAGIAGFLKASLSIYNRTIPPTIHYSKPNPYFKFEDSPFFVQDKLKKWEGDKPLIIGISSLGIGGTNVHVILEEPPVQQKSESQPTEWPELVLLSAKSQNSLLRRKQDLVDFLKTHSDVNINDVAYSLKTGRNHMKFRSFTVASSTEEMITNDLKFTDGKKDDFISKIAFMFPGQGAQYISMGYDLYKSNELFRQILDDCFEIVGSETGEDLKRILFHSPDKDEADIRLASTEITQPALFIIEYALARVFMQFGIKPAYLIGHSIGEYTAACIAGVFDLQTALKIVLTRGRLMKSMPAGSMMAVQTSHAIIETFKADFFEIAADNADNFCTISMKPENVVRVKKLLDEKGIQYIPLNTSHAFHSADFDPILDEFSSYVDQFRLNVPKLPFISCLTGEFITDEQAVSGSYWAQQLRNSVLFRKGISTIIASDNVAFLEVGPNTHLSSLVRQNEKVANKKAIIATLGKADKSDERYRIIAALGNIFNTGLDLSYEIYQNDFIPAKITLPAYPFDRIRCWIDFNLSDVKDNQILADSEEKNIGLLKEAEKTVAEQDNLISPEEKTSNIILKIWKTLFGIEEIGPEDNFFDIGGHSLLALQILTRIKEELGYKISLKDFLDNSTINKLTQKIIKENPVKVTNEKLSFRSEINSFPLSFIQKRIWIISQFDGLNPAYNIPFTLHFKGDVNLDIFRQSVNVLFNRHFTMFSVFKQKEGEPYCEIIPRPVDVEFFDFTDSSPETREEKIFSFIQTESRRKFNLETGPLYRLCLLKQNDSSVFFHATIHHLIFDGWSWSIFISELKSIYECLLLNKKIELPDVKNYYLDYARELLAQDIMPIDESSANYWVENLKGCTPQLNFPFDFPRKDVPSGFGEKESITISTESTAKLKKIALREHATPFATLLSLMGLLYQRYSGENDICIGTHVANRPTSSQEKIFGMFVNTIPVRLRLDEVQTFSKLINNTKDVLLEAITHQELPFEKIVELVNPERSFSVNPIFQVAVQWLTYSSKPLDFIGFTAEHVDVKEGISTFDITFNLWENDGQIEGEIEYNVDILSRATIRRLRDNFLHLIESAVEDPEQAISRITTVSETDMNMLSQFNQTESLVPDCSVQNSFENQVKITPFKTAVISGERSITYKELDDRSNQLANYLLRLGVKPGDIVGICIERSVDMVISVLGVLKAGCCYLPMDPSFPEDRIGYMFEDSGARVLISQSSLKEKTGNFPTASIVLTDSDSEVISKYSTEKPQIKIDNQSLAYIIYTSGSTGKPKGVKVHHESVVNLIESMAKEPGIKADDILLAVVTLSFDMSVFELFVTLSKGATVVVAGSQDTADGQALIKVIDKYNITMLQATPSLWNILLASGWKGKRDLRAFCGGEALTKNLLRQVLPMVSEFWNCYGPTETTVYSTILKITDSEAPILIGKPINNTRIYILDKNSKQVPIGVVGEVCIGGRGVTKGYNNKPELTAEKFIRYEKDEIIYKTGDLGRFLTDGNIELFGRIDNQIKLRGFRIEPGEIESLLSQLKGVKEAVVKIHRFEENDERLVAFLNIDTSFNLKKDEIIRSLSHLLPAYMIPSFFQMSDGFPKLPNGKINKKALILKIDESDRKRAADTEMDKFTPSELIIYDIWRKTLKNNEISKTDNFFDIGGNSLLAISVFSKLESAFNLDLSLRVFFDSPRIKDLAEAIDLFMLKTVGQKPSERTTGEDARIVEGEI